MLKSPESFDSEHTMLVRTMIMTMAALTAWACTPDNTPGKSGPGGPCALLSDCETGLFCSADGVCYDPAGDGDLDADSDGDGDGDGDGDSDADSDADADEEPCTLADTDGDGIADLHEGDGVDTDGDGIPDVEDTDSDGDGIPDSVEAGDDDPCTWPADHDGDGVHDFRDLDSDADGLTDNEEAVMGSSPYHVDTDGDGVDDFIERAAGTRPDDGSEFPDPDEVLVFILPYMDEDGPQTKELDFQTTIRIADVLFLMDTTNSMSEEIANLRERLSDVAASLAGLFDDVAMGVGRFDDFPVLPYGNILYGDRVFEAVQQITDQEVLVQAAVDSLDVRSGQDLPESQVPALWHIATGDPIGYFLPRAVIDHTVSGTGTIGGVGFRDGSQPIVVLVTDAPMHNGAGGTNPYDDGSLGVTAPTYDQAIDALNGIGARVVGIGGDDAQGDLVTVATDTGSVLHDGQPLVYSINPDGTAPSGDLSSQVTDGIEDLVLGTPQDVSTIREDDPSDAVDATLFLRAVRPIRGVPEAPEGYDSHDGATNAYGTFFGVIPGTHVVFEVEAYNDIVEHQESTQVFRLTVVVIGNGVARLDERLVVIVVPAEAGEVPIY